MATKSKPLIPLTADDRDKLIEGVIRAIEPLTVTQLAKLGLASRKVVESELVSILDECVASGRLHLWPPKTKAGKRRYWGVDKDSLIRNAVVNATRPMKIPLTAREIASQLTAPIKVAEADVGPILDEMVVARSLHRIPAATKKGKVRYWDRDDTEFARITIKAVLSAKGPLQETQLKGAVKWLNGESFQRLINQMVVQAEIRRHPALGKIKVGKFGLQPPQPGPYLHDLETQLAKTVAALIAADVSRDDLRRALVQMIEAAGISFVSSPSVSREERAASTAPSVDLIAVMHRIEPGAERGALVGARDLRRAARLEKTEFDRTILELSRQGRLSLHRHDYPASLSQEERDELVTDGSGTYYVGIALRQNA